MSFAEVILRADTLITIAITYVITMITFNMGIDGHVRCIVDEERRAAARHRAEAVANATAAADERIGELERRIDVMNHKNLRVQELEEDLDGAHELIAELERDNEMNEFRIEQRDEMLVLVKIAFLCFFFVTSMFSLLFITKYR